jgi:hypothetical protein
MSFLKNKIYFTKNIAATVIALILFSSFGNRIKEDDMLFEAVKDKFFSTPNYECDIKVTVDVSFIKIPERKGKMSYDKVKGVDYKLKGFAFLPKGSFIKQSQDILTQDHTVINLGVIDSSKDVVYKVIPTDINSKVVIGQFWINVSDTSISKMAFVMKDFGDYTIDLTYDEIHKTLPSRINVNFNIENKQLPSLLTGDLEDYEDTDLTELEKKENTKASIVIDYFNYEIFD